MNPLHGIIPACVTPFIDDHASPEAMAANIERWLPTGVDGFLIFGSTGEFVYVDDDERQPVLEAARAAIPPHKTMLVGCGGESRRRTLRYLRQAAETGADAALVVTPVYYTRGRSAAQRAFYQTIAEHSPLPVLMYNVPPFTAYELPVDLILELAQQPNIIGIKDSSGDPKRVSRQLAQAPADFAIFSGNPNALLQALAMGAAGGILAFGNIIPEVIVALAQAVQANDLPRAASLQMALSSLHSEIADYGIPGIKAILEHRGLAPGHPRLPLLPLSPEQRQQTIAAWERCMAAARSTAS